MKGLPNTNIRDTAHKSLRAEVRFWVGHKKKMCHVAELFDFAAWHQMASWTFHVLAFDCNEFWSTPRVNKNGRVLPKFREN